MMAPPPGKAQMAELRSDNARQELVTSCVSSAISPPTAMPKLPCSAFQLVVNLPHEDNDCFEPGYAGAVFLRTFLR